MNLSTITNPAAKAFIYEFFANRDINREVYEKIPADKFDFRMTPKSDSPRESLVHQIETEIQYIKAVKDEKLVFGTINADIETLKKLSKEELLQELKKQDEELIKLLSNEQLINNPILVPWSKDPIPAISMLWGLNTHEVLHTGWNLALMDHLGIARFPKLKVVWG